MNNIRALSIRQFNIRLVFSECIMINNDGFILSMKADGFKVDFPSQFYETQDKNLIKNIESTVFLTLKYYGLNKN